MVFADCPPIRRAIIVACEVVTMIDFKAVITHFGPHAVDLQVRENALDDKALQAVSNRNAPDRIEAVRSWLQSYQVFMGIDGPRRPAIAEAILVWADAQDGARDLSTVDSLDQAHRELVAVCVVANGEPRDFTSLASKALWLCYPESVPLFDSFAQRALWVICKMDDGITPLCGNESSYRKFLHVWMALYERYSDSIEAVDMGNYPYRVRLFDRILWIIGTPDYKYSARPSVRDANEVA